MAARDEVKRHNRARLAAYCGQAGSFHIRITELLQLIGMRIHERCHAGRILRVPVARYLENSHCLLRNTSNR